MKQSEDRFDPDHQQTNRQKRRAPRRFWEYCPGCDMTAIVQGQKCWKCGYREKPSRDKK